MLGSKPAAAAAKPAVGALNGAFGAMSLGASAKPTAAPQTPVKPAVVASPSTSPDNSPGGSPNGSQNGSPTSSRSATPPQADQKGGQQQAAKPAGAAPANANAADDAEEELSLHNVDLGSLAAVNKCIGEFTAELAANGKSAQQAAYLKAFVNERNDNNATPLHMVAVKCSTILANPDVMRVTMRLLELGASPNAQTKDSSATPMHTALGSYSLFMLTKPAPAEHTVHSQFNVLRSFCGLMISRGADCTLKTLTGKTALQGLAEVMPASLKAVVKIDRDSLLAHFNEGVAKAVAARNAQSAGATVAH